MKYKKSVKDYIEPTVIILFIASLFFSFVTLFGMSFEYNLMSIFGKDVPWFVDVFGGIFTSAFSLQLTIGLWIAHWCGVVFPLL